MTVRRPRLHGRVGKGATPSVASPAAEIDPVAEARLIADGVRYAAAWRGRTVVVKYGGSVLDAGAGGTVVEDLVLLKNAGVNPVLVHGGGPEITRMLDRVGKKTEFVRGLRVTDDETMEIVEMVLSGRANKALVTMLSQAGGSAVGLSGKDAGLFRARQVSADLGLVGEVTDVRSDIIGTVSAAGHIPVVSSIGVGPRGESLNLNADHAAGALAAGLGASKLIILTDVPGIMRPAGERPPGEGPAGGERQALISSLTAPEARRLIAEGVVSRGMIPKVEACLIALDQGVPSAHIIGIDAAHALLVELFTEEGIGTMITATPRTGVPDGGVA